MKNKSLLNLSCTEAAGLCEKAEYREANSWERIKLKLHIFLCKRCKDYYERSHKLTGLLQKADLHTCSPAEKEAYRKKMNDYQSNCSKKNKDHKP